MFQASSGLRQGDALSLSLFVIFIDFLSHLILRAESANAIHGIKIGKHCPLISHLLYTDDATFFYRTNSLQLQDY